MSKGRRADALETRAGRLGLVNRRRRGEALVSRRTGQLLDHISEVVLVDIVDRRLLEVLLRRRLTLVVKSVRFLDDWI